MGIVVVGAIFVDIKGFPYGTYLPNGRNSGRIEYVYGGVCRNVVQDIAHCGLNPTFISLVDDSGVAKDLLQQLKDSNVNCDYIRSVQDGMGTWLAVFNEKGDVAGQISKRPDLHPITDIIDEHYKKIISDSEALVFEIDIEEEIITKLVQEAEKQNKPIYGVVSNMTIALEKKHLIEKLNCLVCNQEEAGILFGEDYTGCTRESLAKIIQDRMKTIKVPNMIVTMGGQGCVYANKDEIGFLPANDVIVKDTTGAGDSFFAGVVVGLTYGKTLKEAAVIGTTLASNVITSSRNVVKKGVIHIG